MTKKPCLRSDIADLLETIAERQGKTEPEIIAEAVKQFKELT